MTVRHQSGFTLIELLIVVALIGVLASIAAPALSRAKRAGNEASAISSLRAIVSAQQLYYTTCGENYFAPSLVVLGQAPAGGTAFLSPDISYAATVVKSGYTVTMGSSESPGSDSPASCNGVAAGAGLKGYFATATPNPSGGNHAYGVNTNAIIYHAIQDTPLAMTNSTAPAGSWPIPQ
jgi:prepilin-type N-terminal cleavage/methylation domain-containing protein